jgi:hypothetical protein
MTGRPGTEGGVAVGALVLAVLGLATLGGFGLAGWLLGHGMPGWRWALLGSATVIATAVATRLMRSGRTVPYILSAGLSLPLVGVGAVLLLQAQRDERLAAIGAGCLGVGVCAALLARRWRERVFPGRAS